MKIDNDTRRRERLPALTIAALYKSRWQVELFFKWIKAAPAEQSRPRPSNGTLTWLIDRATAEGLPVR
jgi:IS4 transposase